MYATAATLSNQLFVPVSFAQTELRRGKEIQLAAVELAAGQSLEVRVLVLHLISVLTPGVVPALYNKSLGLCSVGLYLGPMRCSGPLILSMDSSGAVSSNPFALCKVTTKGLYTLVVGNNTSNIDVSVAVTGALKVNL